MASSSTCGTPSAAPRRRARVVFPAPELPTTDTRFTRMIVALVSHAAAPNNPPPRRHNDAWKRRVDGTTTGPMPSVGERPGVRHPLTATALRHERTRPAVQQRSVTASVSRARQPCSASASVTTAGTSSNRGTVVGKECDHGADVPLTHHASCIRSVSTHYRRTGTTKCRIKPFGRRGVSTRLWSARYAPLSRPAGVTSWSRMPKSFDGANATTTRPIGEATTHWLSTSCKS